MNMKNMVCFLNCDRSQTRIWNLIPYLHNDSIGIETMISPVFFFVILFYFCLRSVVALQQPGKRLNGFQSRRRYSDTKILSHLCPALLSEKLNLRPVFLRGTSLPAQKEETIEEDAESNTATFRCLGSHF